jgi:hypothetical protein
MGCCLAITIFVKDKGLQRKGETAGADVEAGIENSITERKSNSNHQAVPQAIK